MSFSSAIKEAPLAVKVAHAGELRRFRLPPSAPFATLVSQLAQLYGAPVASARVTYVDQDGDRITVASELEWQEALREFAGASCVRLELVPSLSPHAAVGTLASPNARSAPTSAALVPAPAARTSAALVPAPAARTSAALVRAGALALYQPRAVPTHAAIEAPPAQAAIEAPPTQAAIEAPPARPTPAPAPEVVGLYAKQGGASASLPVPPALPAAIVPMLAKLFPGGLISLDVPAYLRRAVSFRRAERGAVDLDIDLEQLHRALEQRSLALFDELKYAEAESLLGDMSAYWPTPFVFYNLACAQSLQLNTHAAALSLKAAIDAGYRNLGHMIADNDLGALRAHRSWSAICNHLVDKLNE